MKRKEMNENKTNEENKKGGKFGKIVKIGAVLIIIYVLFQIPMSDINSIGRPSTDPDDHTTGEDYEVTNTDPSDDVTLVEPEAEDQKTDDEIVAEEESSNDITMEEPSEEAIASDTTEQDLSPETVMEEAKQWTTNDTRGSAFSAIDETMPVTIKSVAATDSGANYPETTYFISNNSGKDLRQVVLFVCYYDEDGMPFIINEQGHPQLDGDRFIDPITVTNVPANDDVIYDDVQYEVDYSRLQHMAVFIAGYEDMDGNYWSNAYMPHFLDYSGKYVWDLRNVAQGCIFDLS